jgi:hypothetical protein
MIMTNTVEYPTATPESVWAMLRELAERQAETDRQLKEQMKETDRQLKEQMKETDRQLKEQMKETDRQLKTSERILTEKFAETDRQINKVNETLGSWAKNHGNFAEEYFFNAFERGERNFFGEEFDRIKKNVSAGLNEKYEDEYDILLINGKSIGIVEVKYKAHENDLPKVLRKAETFRVNFPEYANHQVYLGLATMAFYSKLEETCAGEGIAVIKQVGGTAVVNYDHLKVF